MVVFLCALLFITALTLSLKPLTEGQREKEKEMIWRGNQYVRAIKLYYRKTVRYPQSLEDLTKPKLGQLRFLRKAYADPMNPDGSWRLIYVGPAGQLIGSLKPAAQNPLFPGGQSGQNSGLGQSLGAAQTFGTGQGPGFGQNPAAGTPGATGASSATAPVAGSAGTNQQEGGAQTAGCPKQNGASDQSSETTIIGGNIIGVGSKSDRPSLKVLDKQTYYCKWEFIWDPSKDVQMAAGQQQQGGQIGTTPGAPSPGSNPNPQQNSTF
jgi:hypothetical protein